VASSRHIRYGRIMTAGSGLRAVLGSAVIGSLALVPVPQAPDSRGPATRPGGLEGRLRIADGSFRDDRGPVLPVYAHAGDLFSQFVRDEARALTELDAVAGAGYHGVRVWAALGCGVSVECPAMTARGEPPFWQGREVGPELSKDYFDQVRRFFEAIGARRLRAVWSLGDVQVIGDRRAFMSRIAALDNELGVIDWIDCGNEAWQGAGLAPAELAACVGHYAAAGGRALKTLTSPPTEEVNDLDAYSIDPADAFDVHSFRGGRSWDKRRHIASLTRDDRPGPRRLVGINSEPPGAGALVSATEHPEELDEEAVALLAAASLIARQAFVWFSGEGVQIDRGLATAVGFQSVPAAVRLLPLDVMRFQRRHHSGERWKDVRVLEAQGEVRVDGAQADDGRFAYTIDGPPGTYELRVARGFEAGLCHPATAACEPVAKKAGETLRVTFTRGRLFVGKTR
jgi:hypothetical protein